MSKIRTLLYWAAAVLMVAGTGCQQRAAAELGERPDFGGDFSLTNQDGQTFQLMDVRGKAVVMCFGYTSCPDVCPVTMSRITSALDRLSDKERAQVVTLFVSVDPMRDTPPVMKEYVESCDTNLVGLTGSEEDIARVAETYQVSYQIANPESSNYIVNHS